MGKVTNRISNICGLAVVSGGLLGLTGFAGMLLATPEASAESANASVNVAEACAMTSTGNTTHTAEVENGRYVQNIGTTSFNITCNDAGGFSVYAVGFTGDEIGGTNSTKLVGSSNAGLTPQVLLLRERTLPGQ